MKKPTTTLTSFIILEKKSPGPVPRDKIRTIFEEWQRNRILNYKVKHTEFEFLRTRLLKIATPAQEERMFRRALKVALESYNNRDFPLAHIQLRDLIITYGQNRVLDDIDIITIPHANILNITDETAQILIDWVSEEFKQKKD